MMRALPSSFVKPVVTSFTLALILATSFSSPSVAAQEQSQAFVASPRPLITQALDESRLTVLKGNTHPLARREFDLGTAPASLPMERMLLVLKRSDEQEIALRKLLDDQQDKTSPNYHKWMTPEQFGAQFGPSDADLQTITSWLQSHGFQVGSTKGRTVLEFSGSASQVEAAFHTTIHKYVVNGEQHWANASDPQIPVALAPVVAGMASLNNFPRKPMSRILGVFSRDKTTGNIQPVEPVYTLPSGCAEDPRSTNPCFYGVSPYDFATIYDVLPLWNTGINGTGQTMAIVGETNVNVQDVRDFRTLFGLPANDPQIILNGPDPGIRGDEVEANLDLQWSGAVAPNATIKFVTSASTETTAGIDLSAVYIVENNLAPVMSESYGYCELGLGTAGNQFYNTLWQQAAAQGITVFISSGDNGSAGCDDFNAASPAPAQFGLQVSGFASTPYNVAVGGTDFNDFLNPSTYWNITNSTTQASAKGYIPEVPWNSTCTNPIFGQIGYSTNPETNCNDSQFIGSFDVPVGGSGGASHCTTSDGSTPGSCSGGYAKPSWQTGTGVPNDGKRDIPDVSLFASSGFLGNFYMMCEVDITGAPCSLAPNYYFIGIGGTSASSPAFAGIMALVNQQMAQTTQNPNERQGNANYIFYKLAAQQPTAFHDVTSGTIAMPCATGSLNCTTSVSGHAYGVLSGYNATSKYDLATGLGTVDVNNLVMRWNSVTLLSSTTTLSNLTPTTVTHGQAVNFTVSVAPKSGTGAKPTGLISLQGGPTNSTADIQGFNLTNGTVTGTTQMLPGGTYSVTAHYPGDSMYAASDSSPVSVTVNKENSQQDIFLVTYDPSGNGRVLNGHTNTAEYGTSYLLRVNVENAAGQVCSPFGAAKPTACPSGTVNLTNNGSPLNPGTYSLNEYGYTEDRTIQLPGGTDSVAAAYSGDSSFSASTVTAPITITPAPTQLAITGVTGAVVGQLATISAIVVPYTVLGAAPSGTVTFYANGSPLNGTVTYSPGGVGPRMLNASLTYSFTTPGDYTISATYNGDSNYGTASNSFPSVTVKYPTPTVNVTPYNQMVNYGGTATINILVDTTNQSVYPTGTVTLGNAAGPLACTNAKDASGNFACNVTATFTVTSGGTIQVQYSGDSNYPSSYSWAYIVMPDFMFSASGWVQVTAGQSQNLTVTFTSLNGLSGTISNFGCSSLPAEMTCTFNPTQVTLPTNGTVSTALTVTTTALGQASYRASNGLRANGAASWPSMLLALCLAGIPFSRRRRRIPVELMLVLLFLALPSCGGGGGGGGGAGNAVPAIISLNPTKVAAGSQVQGLYINGTNFMSTSTVTYNGTPHDSSLQSPTQLQIGLGPSDVAATGQYPVVVINPSPGGGPSAPMNFSIVTGTPTGIFTANLNATIGPITHNAQLSMNIQ